MFDALVVGAGQAGLAMSYHLRQRDVEHVVLELGEVGETWRSQRWDSFAVNTPNWAKALPGDPYRESEADGFHLRDQLVESFERYREKFDLPVRARVDVTSVLPAAEGGFSVGTSNGAFAASNVIVAAGVMNAPRVPAVSARFPESITQLHTASYRNPEQLPEAGGRRTSVRVGSAVSSAAIAAGTSSSGGGTCGFST